MDRIRREVHPVSFLRALVLERVEKQKAPQPSREHDLEKIEKAEQKPGCRSDPGRGESGDQDSSESVAERASVWAAWTLGHQRHQGLELLQGTGLPQAGIAPLLSDCSPALLL